MTGTSTIINEVTVHQEGTVLTLSGKLDHCALLLVEDVEEALTALGRQCGKGQFMVLVALKRVPQSPPSQ